MLAVAFDTLKLARKLESAGFPAKQAQDASAALAEAFAEWQTTIDLATRQDLQKTGDSLRQDLQKTGDSLRENLQRVDASIQRVETSSRAEAALLRSEMREMELRIVVRLGGMVIALGAVLIAIRYFG